MPRHVELHTAPSSWASYLINGDASGLSNDERSAADAFVADIGAGAPLDCDDVGFTWLHDACGYWPSGADCQSYVFYRE